MAMIELQRETLRYTARFCEENVWWLIRSLSEKGVPRASMQVWLLTNPMQCILLFNQRAAAPGQPNTWDYHVILEAEVRDEPLIFDMDTRLDFPVNRDDYLRSTFPKQSLLPERYRTWVRVIPAASYLRHFYSDRSHMQGHLPPEKFPDYPIIRPVENQRAISLDSYRDLEAQLHDGSAVLSLAIL